MGYILYSDVSHYMATKLYLICSCCKSIIAALERTEPTKIMADISCYRYTKLRVTSPAIVSLQYIQCLANSCVVGPGIYSPSFVHNGNDHYDHH